MRRTLIGLACLVALAGAPAKAADPTVVVERSYSWNPNLLLINPGDLLSGIVSLEYERALLPWFGLTGGFSVWSFPGPILPPGQPNFVALGPELGARFHFIRSAPGGLWVGPTLSGGYLVSRSDGTMGRAWSWGLGASVGYNFILGRHVTFQLGAGGGFTAYGDLLVWAPRLRLGIGVVF